MEHTNPWKSGKDGILFVDSQFFIRTETSGNSDARSRYRFNAPYISVSRLLESAIDIIHKAQKRIARSNWILPCALAHCAKFGTNPKIISFRTNERLAEGTE